ncbi:MAG: maleylpyruvate isomerase N-terminal domain-containing protein [Cytophagales bacterium]|nr:maleylpyruvate isomerase N-terminal domain-containing protein [Cytophagales bacterium]
MIQTLHLIEPLEAKLIDLLHSLSDAEWNKPTVAKKWTVKDVAAHLLDTSVRTAALLHNHQGDAPDAIYSYNDLVNYLNRLNEEWVKAMRRVSTTTLIQFLELAQKPMLQYYHSLDPQAIAAFSVAWAGEQESKNWFHLAREYTERWHHQQQIRDAVEKPGIMNREFFHPMIDTLLQALPYAYRHTQAPQGTQVQVHISGEAGGTWTLEATNTDWFLTTTKKVATTKITLTPDTAWKLFTKAFSAWQAAARVTIEGHKQLGLPLLKMIAVMG